MQADETGGTRIKLLRQASKISCYCGLIESTTNTLFVKVMEYAKTRERGNSTVHDVVKPSTTFFKRNMLHPYVKLIFLHFYMSSKNLVYQSSLV